MDKFKAWKDDFESKNWADDIKFFEMLKDSYISSKEFNKTRIDKMKTIAARWPNVKFDFSFLEEN